MSNICAICGRPAECTHHLIGGRGYRRLSEEDGLKLRLCNSCHNMRPGATERIHGNSMAEKLSKMLGQALWERDYNYEHDDGAAREKFLARYGRSWL